jgi:DNA-binding winged helix-turn-helix (wHTH) protein
MSSQPSTSPPRQLLFGPFAFDEASGELQKHGVRLRLQGQPLQILVALIGRPGQVVTRDEFQRQLWTDSTFVDFEHGLNAAMNRLRQVLGDSADQPRYIETVAGRGYRFIGLRADGQRLLVPIVTSQEKSW